MLQYLNKINLGIRSNGYLDRYVLLAISNTPGVAALQLRLLYSKRG